MEIVYIILLIFNILLYGACCFLILRRKAFTCISIRSPKLLVLNILGNLFMSIIIIVTKSLKDDINFDGQKICSLFYYICNFLIIIPLCLRFRRIAKCCEIKIDERLELQELYTNKNRYEEKYNIKVLLIIFAILTVILLVVNAIITRSEAITATFLCESDDSILYEANSYIWCAINFIEHILILTCAYYICVNQLKQKLRFEIIASFIIWFIYSNFISILDMIEKIGENNDLCIYLSLAVCYLFLIVNAILPILISYSYRYSTSYSFTPKLMNNMYLFLSNETCYLYFKNYLMGLNANSANLLRLYTAIMNYKLGYKLVVSNDIGFEEAREIRDEFFGAHNSANLPENISEKVKAECQGLVNNSFNEDMFDEALKYCFSELGKIFNDYKKTEEFKDLYLEFFLTTYIQCKMCNIGLINKF